MLLFSALFLTFLFAFIRFSFILILRVRIWSQRTFLEHPSVRSSRLQKFNQGFTLMILLNRRFFFSLYGCIRVEVNNDMHFYPTWFASIPLSLSLPLVPCSFSLCMWFFLRVRCNFLGLFNEMRDLIYWFPLNTHWEVRGNKLWVDFDCLCVFSSSSSSSSLSCLRNITEGVKIQFYDLNYDRVQTNSPIDNEAKKRRKI